MVLDYKENINEFGDNLVRIYGFNKAEATLLRDVIRTEVLENKKELNLGALEFMVTFDFNLIMRLSETDEGVIAENGINYCDLTREGYENMLFLIEPYCHKETRTFAYLYDVDSPTDIIFSNQLS